ncbi:hypothetical protein F0562_015608 [Nyssa sinensis]|uniref:Glycosyltransferase n=1 Tax=Nyssa sinensis TaxID=561372 RepID=A0A5J4ZK07_9ASTE|nr:hypothetical protein F0562_015608 [Nyssa sinensis]
MANHHYHHQNHDQNGLKQGQVVVVMVPLPAQGHLNQLLQFSRLVSSYNIPVHYVGTTTHNRQAKLRVHGWDPLSVANIHFHEFPTPSFLSLPPNPDASNSFPTHLQPLFEASLDLRKPVATTATHTLTHSSKKKPFPLEPEILKEVPSLEGCFSSEFMDFIVTQQKYLNFNSGNLYNTCKAIEGPYIDLLSDGQISESNKHWAIGPFNPVEICDLKKLNQRHKCLEWLDEQTPNSVIFVSFGTTTSFTDEQIKELAIGLEKSEQKFIWVLRDADKGDVFEGEVRKPELPDGFEERMEGKGVVVRDWAPQLEILGHPSTGGFMSHCGWNSCMESLTMGVPIAAWPMHSDQPRNSVLITKVLNVGVVVKDWACRVELVTSLTVERAVRRLMASEEGDKIRKRAAELGGAVRQSVAAGGVSRTELESFIAHINREINYL